MSNWQAALATQFGYNDPEDNGVGAWGTPTANTTTHGVSLDRGTLRAAFGDENLAGGRPVEVYSPATGRRVAAPIVDKGPADWVLARQGPTIDVTEATRRALGIGRKDPVMWRFADGASDDVSPFGDPANADDLVSPFGDPANPVDEAPDSRAVTGDVSPFGDPANEVDGARPQMRAAEPEAREDLEIPQMRGEDVRPREDATDPITGLMRRALGTGIGVMGRESQAAARSAVRPDIGSVIARDVSGAPETLDYAGTLATQATEGGSADRALADAIGARDPERIAAASRRVMAVPKSDAMRRVEAGERTPETFVKTVPEVMARSAGAQIPMMLLDAPARIGAGAAMGAGGGALIAGPAGAAAGAAGGAASGFAETVYLESSRLDRGNRMMNRLATLGYDPTDAAQVRRAIEDGTFAREFATADRRANVVGGVDAATALVSGGVGARMLRGGAGKAATAGTVGAIEAAGGMAGEAGGQVSIREPISAWDTLMEGAAELPGAAIHAAPSAAAQAAIPGKSRLATALRDELAKAKAATQEPVTQEASVTPESAPVEAAPVAVEPAAEATPATPELRAGADLAPLDLSPEETQSPNDAAEATALASQIADDLGEAESVLPRASAPVEEAPPADPGEAIRRELADEDDDLNYSKKAKGDTKNLPWRSYWNNGRRVWYKRERTEPQPATWSGAEARSEALIRGEERAQEIRAATREWRQRMSTSFPRLARAVDTIVIGRRGLEILADERFGDSEVRAAYQRARDGGWATVFLVAEWLGNATRGEQAGRVAHELGHHFWESFNEDERAAANELWEYETTNRVGPLYRDGQPAHDNAGVDTDVREWLSERLAVANQDWMASRLDAAQHDGTTIGKLAARARVWARDAFRLLAPDLDATEIDAAYRDFLRAGRRADGGTTRERAGDGLRMSRSAPEDADTLRRWSEEFEQQTGVVTSPVIGRAGEIRVGALHVPGDRRGSGLATRAMSELSDLADRMGRTMTVSPSAQWGSSVDRLRGFYYRFGFVRNLGSRADARLSGTMYRRPRSDLSLSRSSDLARIDAEYMAAVERGDVEAQQRLVDEAARRAGYKIAAYHGTSRIDRVGNRMNPRRATSGPMPFFTTDPEIGQKYTQKSDNSIEIPDDYSGWFKMKVGRGAPKDIASAWYYLPFEERQRIADTLPHVVNVDAGNNEMVGYRLDLDKTGMASRDHWDYEIRQARGNVLKAAVETWLNSGLLVGAEEEFMDILRVAGVKGVEFDSPWKAVPGVVNARLAIRRPFDTENISEADYSALVAASRGKRAKPQRGGADHWDKNDVSGQMFRERLEADRRDGTTYTWTSIPDWATKTLVSLGYDGIKDRGGKHTGYQHTVWIPFYPWQVKSAEPVTRDNRGRVIPPSERFNAAKDDIRFSRNTPPGMTPGAVPGAGPSGPMAGVPGATPMGHEQWIDIRERLRWRGDRARVGATVGAVVGQALGDIPGAIAGAAIAGVSMASPLFPILFESAIDVLERQRNPVAQRLARALNRYADAQQSVEGRLASGLERVLARSNRQARARAKADWSEYYQQQLIGGRQAAAQAFARATPLGQQLIRAWQRMTDAAGTEAQRHNVQVWDETLNSGRGGYRPANKIPDYFPRFLKDDVQRAIDNPTKYAAQRANLIAELVSAGWTQEDAEAWFRLDAPSLVSSDDHFAQLETARKQALPPSFYEFRFDTVAPRFISGYSRRIGQIVAFGQKLSRDPDSRDLFDVAIGTNGERGEALDDDTLDFLASLRRQVYNIKLNTRWERFASNARVLMSGALLSNPVSTVLRNVISAEVSTASALGTIRSLRAIETMRRELSAMDATDLGIIRSSIMEAADYSDPHVDASSVIRRFASGALKLSGYTGSEAFARWHNAATALVWLRDWARAYQADPTSRLSREGEAYLDRMGLSPGDVLTENVDWKGGRETRRAIRKIVRETQFGYDTDQVPLWANSSVGRLMYQFGRWGTQRSRYIWRHVIEPSLFGDLVDRAGTPYRVRNLKPLGRWLLHMPMVGVKVGGAAILTGELFAAAAHMLFERDRDDASWEEIVREMSDDQARARMLLGQRLVNDAMLGGMLGILSQPVDMSRSYVTGARFKNPVEPPLTGAIRAGFELGQSWIERGQPANLDDFYAGHAKDLGQAIETILPVTRSARMVTGNIAADLLPKVELLQKHQAMLDQTNLRKLGRRYAQETGIDRTRGLLKGGIPKSPLSAGLDRLQDKLLVGDAKGAREIVVELLAREKDTLKQEARMRAIKSSVSARQPMKVGTHYGDEVQQDFAAWIKREIPEEQGRVADVQARYVRAARAAGLMRTPTLKEQITGAMGDARREALRREFKGADDSERAAEALMGMQLMPERMKNALKKLPR